MPYQTGTTIYNTIASFDQNNDPVASPIFDIILFKDIVEYTGVAVTTAQIDPAREIYSLTFTPVESGQYQLFVKNTVTDVIWFSEVYDVVDYAGPSVVNVYTGL